MTAFSPDFTNAFARYTRRTGRWRNCEPESLLCEWAEFVEHCTRGYSDDWDDGYVDELTTRDGLERAMREPTLAALPEMQHLRRQVADIDDKFRKILLPNAFPEFPESKWWHRGVVRHARPRLVAQLRRLGVTITPISVD